jgi:hypothetical protein
VRRAERPSDIFEDHAQRDRVGLKQRAHRHGRRRRTAGNVLRRRVLVVQNRAFADREFRHGVGDGGGEACGLDRDHRAGRERGARQDRIIELIAGPELERSGLSGRANKRGIEAAVVGGQRGDEAFNSSVMFVSRSVPLAAVIGATPLSSPAGVVPSSARVPNSARSNSIAEVSVSALRTTASTLDEAAISWV